MQMLSQEIVKNANKEFGKNKVLRGSYIAEQIPRTPMILKEVIRQIVELSTLDSQIK